MGMCARGTHQPPATTAALSLVPHIESSPKMALGSSWKATAAWIPALAAKAVAACPRINMTIPAKPLLINRRSSPLHRLWGRMNSSSPAPLTAVVGHDTFDVWSARRDLQRCQAILHEDVGVTETAAEVIDGKAIAKDIRQALGKEVAHIKETVGRVPGLAVVLVGNRTDSATYVRSKKKACEEVGITNFGVTLPDTVSEEEVLNSIREFNDNADVHGILVQLPLPKHMNEEKVLGAVQIEKDVDGFHPMNVGQLVLQGRTPLHISCTPRGCIELLLRSNVTIKGKHAVVVGRSNVVGMPMAILLQRLNATVTVVHSQTPNPAEVTRGADIVVVAVGVAHLVRADWIKPGAVVIDVGVNSVEDKTAKKGYRLVGDVCYPEVSRVASKITPVPGGVGPMTIAMLLTNTLDAAKKAFGMTDDSS